MALFHPFRALGYVTSDVAWAVQRRGRSTFLTVSAGKSWQTYNCAKLTLLFVGQPVRARRRRGGPGGGVGGDGCGGAITLLGHPPSWPVPPTPP